MSGDPAPPVPRATYRLQLHSGFGFAAATRLVPYLAKLGVSHLYASPYLAARPASTHGYDVVDHNRLNPELGTEEEFTALCAALRAHGLGQIADFVPNHVGIGGSSNLWWLHVLEWGRDSPHARAFDIDWFPRRDDLAGKLLVPLLGEQYGSALEAGRIELRFDAEAGELAVWLPGEHKLPISPRDYGLILGRRPPQLATLGKQFAALTKARGDALFERAAGLKRELAALVAADEEALAAVTASVRRLNGRAGRHATLRRLDRLLSRQHWRLAYWRVAADDINYRRFFNIHELAGLRVEDTEVFDAVHGWAIARLRDGTLDGLRIDHIDGLYDPAGYCRLLRERAGRPFYLVVEKILAAHERLHTDWGVQGTTGYEFAALATGLAVDAEGEATCSQAYAEHTGEPGDAAAYARTVVECKRLIMHTELASELHVLARQAMRIAQSNWRSRDFTVNGLRFALAEVIAHFPVYRTYIDARGADEADRRNIAWAMTRARRAQRVTDASVFDFVQALLLGDLPTGGPDGGWPQEAVRHFSMKAQQLTGPVMAKGVEDTAFYRFNRLLALNEVGARPDGFGVSPAAFHRAMADTLRDHPHTLLATSTHDTKRGEDARARLAVLSELPEEWQRNLRTWSRLVRARLGDVEGSAPPSRNDECLLFQLLLASWPAELTGVDELPAEAMQAFAARIAEAMTKSVREAKLDSSWSHPDEAYEAGLRAFIEACLDVSRPNSFLDGFRPFQATVARLGMLNSLGQLVLKLTVPGVPDIYQGSERWDLSLVDPDNRRPVDHDASARALEELRRGADLGELLGRWHDGAVKLFVTHTLLQLRNARPALFRDGDYLPLEVTGPAAEHYLAFARRSGGDCLLVVVSRLVARLERRREEALECSVRLPPEVATCSWEQALTGKRVEPADLLRVPTLLHGLPAAALISRTGG